MGYIGYFVSKKVEEAAFRKAKGVPGKVAGKLYGKAAGKAADAIYQKVLMKVDQTNNAKLAIGSLEELLSRNPQNLKLILLSDFRVQDCDGHQKYRIDQAVLSSHRWYLYGEKVRKHATVQEKRRGVLKKLFQRTSDPRDFLINLKGQDAEP